MDRNDLRSEPARLIADAAIRPGKWVTAFNSAACTKGRSGNRCHAIWWHPAKIIKVYFDGENELVDLVWLDKEEIVRGIPIEDTNQLTPYWRLYIRHALKASKRDDLPL